MLGPMRRRLAPTLVFLFSAVSLSASAQPADPLASIADADPMTIARTVDRIGDAEVLARLAQSQPRAVQVAAMRAVPFMDGPEAALPSLTEVAAGRDPHLAPEAARALLDATEGLTAEGLARREADLGELTETASRLERIADDETARADLRAACALAAGRLRALGPPATTREREP
jgi:hypothetical protein